MPVETAALTEAVRQLTKIAETLDKTLKEDYPKRREIERDYISREQSHRRVWLMVGLIFISIFTSYIVTVGTISGCFLGKDDKHPSICSLLPGYEDAIRNNRQIILQFKQLQQITQRNSHRLNKLEVN